jgi:hypothetical protein
MTYLVGIGYDETLVEFEPQPMSKGLEFPEWVVSANGLVEPKGDPFFRWEWVNLVPSVYVYIIRDVLGFTTDSDNVVSLVHVQTINYSRTTWSAYNAMAIHRKALDTEFSAGVYRRVSVLFKELSAPA